MSLLVAFLKDIKCLLVATTKCSSCSMFWRRQLLKVVRTESEREQVIQSPIMSVSLNVRRKLHSEFLFFVF